MVHGCARAARTLPSVIASRPREGLEDRAESLEKPGPGANKAGLSQQRRNNRAFPILP
jgi:hypothetical protein